MFDNDFPNYNFDDLGLDSDDFESFSDDSVLLLICWIDDDGPFLCL